MSNLFGQWFAYGFGAAVGKAIFSEGRGDGRARTAGPIRQQTEEEILADEKRYDEEEKRLDAEDARAREK